ncbi:DUF2058 domain-containing protein [Thiomicrorhabdus aquaedulcis]|uniref:DUF2058 domain-containing protein n=1 Tax=Thiomicrorhabdus aquaedulcis TaxID=2211106 RepID=UPI000FD9C9CB|nr:DUF2058 domain-containing protein [Thiomicrorhabdus aquaedulcis]
MAGSLFDQLKKAGLVDAQKAKNIKKQKYQQVKQSKGKSAESSLSLAAQQVAQVEQQKAERDRQLNLERQQVQLKKAQAAELRQIIESNRVTRYEGELQYSFADAQSVKTLQVSTKVRLQLIAGQLRIAKFDEGYVLISEEAAHKVQSRDETVLIALPKDSESELQGVTQEDQEYYARFKIPDDLVW